MAWTKEIIAKYTNRAALLAAGAETGDNKPEHNTIGIVDDELCNTYVYNSTTSKWTVCSGNRYTTLLMPTEIDFDIPDYTRLINITTGAEFIQQP